MAPGRDTKAGKLFTRLSDLPSLPKVVERILKLPSDTATTRDFADLIATDQGLSAKVLRLVNSAFYSLRTPVSSIRQACSLLGIRTLKSLSLSVSVIQVFKRRQPGFDPIRFWSHSLAVATIGRRIAEASRSPLLEDVYIAGLLHDTGIALLAQHYPEEFARLSLPGSEGTPAALALEEEEFGQAHPEVAYHLASQWRLAPAVALGLRHHHTDAARLPPDIQPEARLLIELVQYSDLYARAAGHSFSEADRLDSVRTPPPPAVSGLDAQAMEALCGELDHSIQELRAIHLDFEREKAT